MVTTMTELQPLLIGLVVVLLALNVVSLTWMLSEITRLRVENRILHDQRDFWIDRASMGGGDE